MVLRTVAVIAAIVVVGQSSALAARPRIEPTKPWAKAGDARADQEAAKAAVDQLGVAAQAFQNGQFRLTYDTLQPIMSSNGVKQLPPEMRRAAWFLLGSAAAQLRKNDEAYEAFKISSGLDGATSYDWLMRFYFAGATEHYDDAVDVLRTLVRDFPEIASTLDHGAVTGLYRSAAELPNRDALRFGIAEALVAADWKPEDPFDRPEYIWREHATALAEKGDVKAALAVATRVTDPVGIIKMRADRRLEAVIKASPRSFDVSAAALAQVERSRAAVVEHPRQIKAINRLANDLLVLNKNAETLALVDETLAKARPAGRPGVKPEFDDVNDELIWLLDLRSRALFRLGRHEEGLAALREGARRPEGGSVNTSQSLNLGGAYNELGRPKDALEAIASVESMSEYGLAVKFNVTACAQAQLGDAKALAEAIAELRKLEAFNPGALQSALLCAGDLDAVAAALIAQLADPYLRPDALYSVQNLPILPNAGPFAEQLFRRQQQVVARPDVQAQIRKVGRIETYMIYPLF